MQLNWENLPENIQVQIIGDHEDAGKVCAFAYRDFPLDQWVNVFVTEDGQQIVVSAPENVRFLYPI